jgi:GMP synthase PP-ATPase subunit
MNPKKVKVLHTIVSEDLNIKTELVEDLIEFYYKEVRGLLSNLESPRINIDGLGQFVVKSGVVVKSTEHITKIIDSHDTSTFKAYHNLKGIEQKLDLLNKLTVKIKQEKNKKSQFFKDKNNDKYTKDNLEE